VLALSAGIQVILGVVLWTCARSLGVELSWADCFLVLGPALLASAVPVTIGGWGIREGAMAGGLIAIGTSAPDAVATAILFGMTLLAGALPGAAAWLWLADRRRQVPAPADVSPN
jgi:uncharacterized membrane protein YbhN (UPF0104 family)